MTSTDEANEAVFERSPVARDTEPVWTEEFAYSTTCQSTALSGAHPESWRVVELVRVAL